MLHDIAQEGPAFRLRPVRLEDAGFIVELRTMAGHTRFLHPVSQDVEQQRVWLETYFRRPNDYYFVVEERVTQVPVGTVGIYDLDANRETAEWGRWILKPGSLAATEVALLVYRTAFEVLELRSVYCRTIAQNAQVVSFHDSCGLSRSGVLPSHFRLPDGVFDAIEHRLDCAEWPAVRELLGPRAHRTATLLTRSASQAS